MLDCVENLTRQRHDRDLTENQQNAATVDSCFELVGFRQHGVAQQKVEHQRESSGLPNARGSRFLSLSFCYSRSNFCLLGVGCEKLPVSNFKIYRMF